MARQLPTTPRPVPQTIVYKTVDALDIPLDLYLPDHAKNVPILLWPPQPPPPHLLAAVPKHNIALISADYRLAPQASLPTIYSDVESCITFIRTRLASHLAQNAVDPTRLAVSGSSAGGYLALLAGLRLDPKPQVILPIYPITDPLGTFFTTPQPHPVPGSGPTDPTPLAPFLDPNAQAVANNSPASARGQMYFYMMQEANLASLLHLTSATADEWRVAKSISKCGLPPTYIVHGDADRAVGVEQADEVVGVMVGVGVEVVYERLRGLDHLFDHKAEFEMEGMYEFMLKHLWGGG
ncbi:hypothetical protein LTR08_002254 [Meristemomyces frigidus]|nr:hypothetical protein LTR08_002254 [Meristemomyces frigidus]